jgi:hypothetical protein
VEFYSSYLCHRHLFLFKPRRLSFRFFFILLSVFSLSFSELSGLFLVDCKTRSDLTEEQVGITSSKESWEWHRITS